MISADEALERLRAGNRRFAAGARGLDAYRDHLRRAETLEAQEPFAIVLGCSDSRVPAEIVFDQGLGDLFVIRVAGNIVAPSLVGSVEFAAARFGTPLVVVLGHTGCGAVRATLETLLRPGGDLSGNLRSIVNRVRPCVEPLLEGGPSDDLEALAARAVRMNIRASVAQLQRDSKILPRLMHDAGLCITGAEYSLQTGLVDFFDDGATTP